MGERTIQDLWQLQGLPLNLKIRMTKDRIRQWIQTYGEDGVYVSFSGGKDSTVLLHLVREMYPNVKAVFVDTGLEYPEIRQFVKTFDNVDWLKPKKTFKQVIQQYGYPFFGKEISSTIYGARKYLTLAMEQESVDRQTDRQTDMPYACNMADVLGVERRKDKENPEYQNLKKEVIPSGKKYKYGKPVHMLILEGKLPHTENGVVQDGEYSTMYDKSRYQFMLDAPFEVSAMCCNEMKKAPTHKYADEMGRNPMTAQMASESSLRTKQWLTNGCNGFDMKRPISNPMAFWTEQDVLLYIYQNHLPICSVYGDVVKEQGQDGQMDLEDYFGKELFDLGRPLLKTTGCNRTG